MSCERISQKQGITMMVLFIIGSSSLFIMGLDAREDVWLANIIAILFSSIVMIIYARILSFHPEIDFFDALELYLGKILSRIFLVFLTWFAFDLCSLVFVNFGDFITTVGLPETPISTIFFIMGIVCIFAVKLGIEAIGRWSEIFVVFIIFLVFFAVLLTLGELNFNNLKPTLYNGLSPVIKGSFGLVTFPLCETVVFLLVFPGFNSSVSKYNVFLQGMLIGALIIFIISVVDVLLLGANNSIRMMFPSYEALSIISFGRIFERVEIIAATGFTIAVFAKITILLLASCKGISRIFNIKDYRTIVIPVAFMIINNAYLSFDNVAIQHDWAFKVFPYYSLPFEIIIPIIIVLIFEIKSRRRKSILERN